MTLKLTFSNAFVSLRAGWISPPLMPSRRQPGTGEEIEPAAMLTRTGTVDEHPEYEDYARGAPAWASNISVSCSS